MLHIYIIDDAKLIIAYNIKRLAFDCEEIQFPKCLKLGANH